MKDKNLNINTKAVALKYDKLLNDAPKVLSKGTGKIADNIIEIAKEHDVPIQKDEDLVELLSKLNEGKEIPPNMYNAVAEIFVFLYNVTKNDEDK